MAEFYSYIFMLWWVDFERSNFIKNTLAVCNETKSEEENIKDFLEKHKCKIIGAATAVVGAPLVLSAAGFGAAGVAAGSAAATIQSAVYGGAATGIFSSLQSAGAAGMSTATNFILGGTGAYAGSYYCGLDIPSESLMPNSKSNKSKPNNSNQQRSKPKVPVIVCNSEGVQCNFLK